ncbi:MAG: hypothetical protein OJF60_001508 [Burkholderiaceae bacterium]|nr:MAG: hypothetical protein OJF60_001508 [Burkholderiaceae bacterium]
MPARPSGLCASAVFAFMRHELAGKDLEESAMKKLLALTAACTLAAGSAITAYAQSGAAAEIKTAHAHALLAQGSTALATAHMHLQHVVNCLVGPGGTGFDAAPGNPCKGQGNGAIPDSASDQAVKAKLQAALEQAQAGLKLDSLAAVQQDAGKVAAALQDTPAQKKAGSYSW